MTKSIEIESLSKGFALFFGAQDHHSCFDDHSNFLY